MASNPKSILFFLFVLTLISTNNSFESNRFLEDKNVFENIFKKKERRQSIVQKLTDIKKFNENQEEKNLFLNIFSKKKKDKNDPPSSPKNVPAPPQNEPAPLRDIETTNKEKLIDRDIENSIIDDDNMEKPLYIQDSFDNLFSNEKNFSKKLINVKCFWVNDFDIYSLEKLSTDKGYSATDENEENKVLFSLCKNLKDKEIMALLNNNINASGSIDDYTGWDVNSKNLTIKLPEGEECKSDNKKKYQVVLSFECDDDDSADIDDEKENFKDNLKLNINGC